jgi:hypothetical protein
MRDGPKLFLALSPIVMFFIANFSCPALIHAAVRSAAADSAITTAGVVQSPIQQGPLPPLPNSTGQGAADLSVFTTDVTPVTIGLLPHLRAVFPYESIIVTNVAGAAHGTLAIN